MPDTYPYTRPILPRLSFLIRSVVPLAVALTGCATAPRRSPLPEVTNEVPPEVKTRLFGRWTCGSELPRGRPTTTIELLRHLGPGLVWVLVVVVVGLVVLLVVGFFGWVWLGFWFVL